VFDGQVQGLVASPRGARGRGAALDWRCRGAVSEARNAGACAPWSTELRRLGERRGEREGLWARDRDAATSGGTPKLDRVMGRITGVHDETLYIHFQNKLD